MTDRELLELAAKAVGLKLQYNYLGGRDPNQPWDPLEDDGDALRLAVKLWLTIDCHLSFVEVRRQDVQKDIVIHEKHDNKDSYAATRRAIVRAAAEIGRSMT